MAAPTAPIQQAAPITQPQQQPAAAKSAPFQMLGSALPAKVLLRPQQSPLRIGGPSLDGSGSDLDESDDADHLSNSPRARAVRGYHEL